MNKKLSRWSAADLLKRIRKIKFAFRVIPLVLSIAALLAASFYIGLRQGSVEPYIGTVPSDVVSYNTLLEAPLEAGDIYANGIHTFLLKYPLILLQNWLGLNPTVLTVFAVAIMLATNGGLAYLIWRFSGRKRTAATCGILALVSINILTNVNYFFLAQSWLTVRNIEIPMMVLALVWLANAIRLRRWQKVLTVVILALNFVSDRLLMYYMIAALGLYLLLTLFQSRKNWLKTNSGLIKLGAWAMLVSFALEFALDKLGLVKFAYTYPSSVSMVGSFEQFFATLGDGAQSLFYVFGADFWTNTPWSPVYLVNVALLLAGVGLVFYLVRKFIKDKSSVELEQPANKSKKAAKPMDFYNLRAITLVVCYGVASFGCYAMLNHTQGLGVDARFLIFIPAIVTLLVAWVLRDWRPRWKMRTWIISAVLMAAFAVGAVVSMNQTYTKHEANLAAAEYTYTTMADILHKENITVLVGGYPYLHSIKWVYEQNYDNKLDLAVMLDNHCNVADSKSARKSWFTPEVDHPQRVAVFSSLLPCNEQQLTAFYGQPARTYMIVDEQGQLQAKAYVFDEDIRLKFDMKNFETN
jgi:hypothetical protein